MIYTRLVISECYAFSFISSYERRYRKYGCIFVLIRTYTSYHATVYPQLYMFRAKTSKISYSGPRAIVLYDLRYSGWIFINTKSFFRKINWKYGPFFFVIYVRLQSWFRWVLSNEVRIFSRGGGYKDFNRHVIEYKHIIFILL